MASAKAAELGQEISKKIVVLKEACAGLDEETAAKAPAGRWSPKEILSHLVGPKQGAYLRLLQIFLEKETPTIDMNPGDPFLTKEREQTTFSRLLAEIEDQYQKIADFARDLTDEQLARTAHIPHFKDSPLGEYPSLAGMINGLGVYHVQMHIDQMREIRQELGA